jgi:hypothetical protein
MSYQILQNPPRIKCFECGFISPHPGDIKYKFCANCSKFHEKEADSSWLSEQMSTLAKCLEEQNPENFQQLVEAVKAWNKESDR